MKIWINTSSIPIMR